MGYGYNNGYKPSFKEKIVHFFSGRNGTDTICYATFGLYLAISVVNLFLSSVVLWAMSWILIAYMWFRVFSRNLYKRRLENEKFRAVFSKISRYFRLKKRAFNERKDFSYRKCPGCKSTLRLPKKKGKHTTRCPRCGKEFTVKI
ncbi:MAG: hypothetical protein E7597_04075 [Ruminococcaceae bacterium]|nr:hypothetical protein [Oscillospiraceae bacterium]